MIKPTFADCPGEQGFCLKADGSDPGQFSGQVQLNNINVNTPEKQEECLLLCRSIAGATGCEAIWDRGNMGCYVHTQEVASGSGDNKHFCWIFSKC